MHYRYDCPRICRHSRRGNSLAILPAALNLLMLAWIAGASYAMVHAMLWLEWDNLDRIGQLLEGDEEDEGEESGGDQGK
jgi:hypothetical protein